MIKQAAGATLAALCLAALCLAAYGSARPAVAQPAARGAVTAQPAGQLPARPATPPTAKLAVRLQAAQARPTAAMTTAIPAANTLATAYSDWAGYAVGGDHLQSVSAHWTVPTGHCGPGESQAAFWVGMDMTTVEQTGVALDCSGHGARSYSGWYQMYPSAPVGFSGPVQAGDHMTGSVTYQGHGWFVLKLADATQHWSRSVETRSYRSRRATAEVISEASYGPLANFGTVHFSNAMVNGRPMAQDSPERINMIAAGHTLAVTGGLRGGGNFDISWRTG